MEPTNELTGGTMGDKMTREEYDRRRYVLDSDFVSGKIGLKEYQEKRAALDLEWSLGHAENGEQHKEV